MFMIITCQKFQMVLRQNLMRRLFKMENRKLIVKVDTSENPWNVQYTEFSFDRSKIENIAKELIVECTGREYSASCAYGKHVSYVLEKYWDNTCGSIKPLYTAILVVLKELKKPDEGWRG